MTELKVGDRVSWPAGEGVIEDIDLEDRDGVSLFSVATGGWWWSIPPRGLTAVDHDHNEATT